LSRPPTSGGGDDQLAFWRGCLFVLASVLIVLGAWATLWWLW
jgi:hypothetical protein